MSAEAAYLVPPNINNNHYKSIEREINGAKKGASFRRCLSPAELRAYLDDPVWVAFRITILVLLIITFASLLCLSVWICYNEYVYNCLPHHTTTANPPTHRPHIMDTLMRPTRSEGSTTNIP